MNAGVVSLDQLHVNQIRPEILFLLLNYLNILVQVLRQCLGRLVAEGVRVSLLGHRSDPSIFAGGGYNGDFAMRTPVKDGFGQLGKYPEAFQDD